MNEVKIDIVTTPGEIDVLKNLQRKAAQADMMFENLIRFMNDHLQITNIKNYNQKEELPSWLKSN